MNAIFGVLNYNIKSIRLFPLIFNDTVLTVIMTNAYKTQKTFIYQNHKKKPAAGYTVGGIKLH